MIPGQPKGLTFGTKAKGKTVPKIDFGPISHFTGQNEL
jgi:hypothetical protein